ncbi:MAG: GNAT family N-acetyltransferase [Vagococcus sp.]
MDGTIETQRLRLRQMTTADSEEVFNNWTSSENVARYLTWEAHTSVEVTKEYLAFEEEHRKEGWGIVLKETNGGYYSD